MAFLLTVIKVACPQSQFSENKLSAALVPKPASVMEQPPWTSLTNRAGSVVGTGNTQGAATMAVLVIPQEIPQLAAISAHFSRGRLSPPFFGNLFQGFLLTLTAASLCVLTKQWAKEVIFSQLCSEGLAEAGGQNWGKSCQGKRWDVWMYRGPCKGQGTDSGIVGSAPTWSQVCWLLPSSKKSRRVNKYLIKESKALHVK